MDMETVDKRVAEVRAFNRFITSQVGVLQEAYLDLPYSLTEARLIYELAHPTPDEPSEVADVRAKLGVDAGYVSRMLKRLESDNILTRERSTSDARRQLVRLTDAGRELAATLDERADDQIKSRLDALDPTSQNRLVANMRTVVDLLSDGPPPGGYVIRPARVGDFGWVVQRHGELYAAEYGWTTAFEALVARIVAAYLDNLAPERDHAWIAEVDGERVGSIFCVHGDDPDVAHLRLLLVDGRARGLGVGSRLVDECIRFARQAGYRTLTLWTNDVLTGARRIYQRVGFELLDSKAHRDFGPEVVGQHWSLSLTDDTRQTDGRR